MGQDKKKKATIQITCLKHQRGTPRSDPRRREFLRGTPAPPQVMHGMLDLGPNHHGISLPAETVQMWICESPWAPSCFGRTFHIKPTAIILFPYLYHSIIWREKVQWCTWGNVNKRQGMPSRRMESKECRNNRGREQLVLWVLRQISTEEINVGKKPF